MLNFIVEMLSDGNWVPVLDSNDERGDPVATLYPTEADANALMADLQRDPEFADVPMRVSRRP